MDRDVPPVKRFDWRRAGSQARAVPLIALLIACLLPWRPEILSLYNLESLALAIALLFVLAMGQSFVMISGGIDLSQPAVISACGVAGAFCFAAPDPSAGAGSSVVLGLTVMLCTGIVVGAAQGLAVAYLRLPPLLVSLATLMVVGGGTLWATQSNRYELPGEFTRIWYARPAGVPIPLLIVAAVAVVAHFALAHTLFGRRLYAVGQNATVARIAGLPVERTIASSYVVCGFCSGLAGVFYSARLYTASAELVENDVLLDCIAAAVIGGVSLSGGKGKVTGVLAGAVFVALVGNALNLLGLRYWHVLIAKGTVILLAVALDAAGRSRRA